MYVNEVNLFSALASFVGEGPFDHCIVDDFFMPDVAQQLENEFPDFDSQVWHQ
jgi:hypothetical protein